MTTIYKNHKGQVIRAGQRYLGTDGKNDVWRPAHDWLTPGLPAKYGVTSEEVADPAPTVEQQTAALRQRLEALIFGVLTLPEQLSLLQRHSDNTATPDEQAFYAKFVAWKDALIAQYRVAKAAQDWTVEFQDFETFTV